MLKNIIISIKNNKSPVNPPDLSPAAVSYGFYGKSPADSMVITDDTNILKKAKELGYAVLFLSSDESFAEGAEYVAENLEDCDYEYCNTVFSRQKGIALTILETERTIVREMSVEDLPELYELYDDDCIREYLEPLYEYDKEKEFTENYIKNMYGFYGFGLWIVRDKNNGRLIGRAGLSIRKIDGKDCIELGYVIAGDCRRKGYAYEVCTAIKKYAFTHIRTEEIFIVTEKRNLPSCRLAEKLGAKCISVSDLENCEYMIFQCKE